MSMKHYYNHRTGESGYIDVQDNFAPQNTKAGCYLTSKGCGYIEYSYFTYLLHIAIAGIIGVGTSYLMNNNIVVGILIGVASFTVLLFRYSRKKDIGSFSGYRKSYLKRVALYTVITTAIVVFVILVKERII